MKLRVIVKRPDTEPYITYVSFSEENLIRFMQGGYKTVDLCKNGEEEERLKILYNPHGNEIGLGFNCFYKFSACFYGNIILVGTNCGSFCDCTIDLKRARKLFPFLFNEVNE